MHKAIPPSSVFFSFKNLCLFACVCCTGLHSRERVSYYFYMMTAHILTKHVKWPSVTGCISRVTWMGSYSGDRGWQENFCSVMTASGDHQGWGTWLTPSPGPLCKPTGDPEDSRWGSLERSLTPRFPPQTGVSKTREQASVHLVTSLPFWSLSPCAKLKAGQHSPCCSKKGFWAVFLHCYFLYVLILT